MFTRVLLSMVAHGTSTYRLWQEEPTPKWVAWATPRETTQDNDQESAWEGLLSQIVY